jgi:hypothetical protein
LAGNGANTGGPLGLLATVVGGGDGFGGLVELQLDKPKVSNTPKTITVSTMRRGDQKGVCFFEAI